MSRRESIVLKMCFPPQNSQFVSKPHGLTCVHLIHTVQEVVRSARDAVTAHAQAAVCALVSGVVGATANRSTKRSGP